jgi:N-acetylmuramoyl-L-alanine amidase
MRILIYILCLFVLVSCADKQAVDTVEFEDMAFDYAVNGFDSNEELDESLLMLYDMANKLPIDYIFIHCAATPEGFDADAAFFERVWESRGWRNPGYHIIIRLDGSIIWAGDIECDGLSWDNIRNGVKGKNTRSFHISYVGGVDKYRRPKDTRTPEQKQTLKNSVDILKMLYPDAEVLGHRDAPGVNKACPSFSVKDEYN